MRPPSACRTAIGASAPKGTCRWLSRRGGRVAAATLKYNFHRVAGRILCRQLKYAMGYCKWKSGLAATIHYDSALCRSVKHTISSGLSRKTMALQQEDFHDSECGIRAQRSAENNVGAWRHAAIRGFYERRVQCWRRLQ
ncbi:hypothetical protein BC332_33791 [Capsicum chinense]|nr:hypothetical protein BC332_33791 [Capsicum chinense]